MNDRAPFPSPQTHAATLAEKHQAFATNFAWQGKLLVALSDAAIEKLTRKNYSASSLKGVADCTARWTYEKQAQEMGPFEAAVLGGAVHDMFEYLMALKPVSRTLARTDKFAEKLALDRWPQSPAMSEEDAAQVRQSRAKWLEEVRIRYAGYMAKTDLKKVVVIANEMKLEGQLGPAARLGTVANHAA